MSIFILSKNGEKLHKISFQGPFEDLVSKKT